MHTFPFNVDEHKLDIRINPSYNQKNLVIVDKATDEVLHYVSVKSCVKHKTDKQRLVKVFRALINPQIEEYRHELDMTTNVCYICNENVDFLEVDHEYPFSRLVDDFLEQNNLKYEDVHFKQVEGKQVLTDEDSAIGEQWIQYHNEHAILRPICKKCNAHKSNKLLDDLD